MSKEICCNLLTASALVLIPLSNAFAQQENHPPINASKSPIGWQVLINQCDITDGKKSDDPYQLTKVNFYKINGFAVISGPDGDDFSLNSHQTWFEDGYNNRYVPFHETNSFVLHENGVAQIKRVVTGDSQTTATTYRCVEGETVIPIYSGAGNESTSSSR